MPYPTHIRIEFGGTLQARSPDDEIWSCSLRAFPGVTGGPANLTNPSSLDLQAWCDAVAPQLRTWFGSNSGTPTLAATAKLAWVKANIIDSTGHYADSADTNVTQITPQTGGQPSQGAPSFCSVAASFGSDLSRGPASRGRMYLPNYGPSSTGATVDSAHASAVLSNVLALIGIIKAQTAGLNGGVMTPALVSDRQAKWSYIRTVRVGNVYDVQRRRKNAVDEVYVAGGVSA